MEVVGKEVLVAEERAGVLAHLVVAVEEEQGEPLFQSREHFEGRFSRGQ